MAGSHLGGRAKRIRCAQEGQRAGDSRSSRELFVLGDVRGQFCVAVLFVPPCEVQAGYLPCERRKVGFGDVAGLVGVLVVMEEPSDPR